MSSKQYVVWEWENKQKRWRPYRPEVSQLLERAYTKRLKFANLGDADPNLNPYSVDMNSMQLMTKDTNEVSSCVRRQLYDCNSPAAHGSSWEWSGEKPSDWHTYDMAVQCVLENCWSRGHEKVDLNSYFDRCPYLIDFCALTQTNAYSNKIRSIRRLTQASYPVCLTTNTSNIPSTSAASTSKLRSQLVPDGGGGNTKPSKRRGSKSGDATSDGKKSEATGRKGLLSKTYDLRSRTDRYHHLRNDSMDGKFDSNMTLNSDCGSSVSGRRPSIDTVSTYLSQDDDSFMDSQSYSGSQSRDNFALSNLVSMNDSVSDDETFYDVDNEVQRTLAQGQANNKNNITFNYNGTSSNSPFIPIQKNNLMTTEHTRPKYSRAFRRKPPTNSDERMLHQNTRVIRDPPDEDCSICMCSLKEDSSYVGNDTNNDYETDLIVALTLCNHEFHEECLKQMVASSKGFLACPNCKTIHGNKTGTQPNGRMNVTYQRSSLPGHSDCGSIQITYYISDGIQGPEHPNPGQHYRANGFPRTAYLPNNVKGKKVLALLQEAWNRRLIFTIGRSVTLGSDNSVTWNEIHHKTEWNNSGGHGYPDPGYLDRVISELAAQGVVDSTDV